MPSSIPERKEPRNLTIHKIKADTLDDPQKRAMAWRAYKIERRIKMGRVEGKVAMVTGAAASLGEADARLLAKEGAKVVITTRKKVVEGRVLAEDIKKKGGEATFIKLDVTKESDWREAIDEVIRKIWQAEHPRE